MYGSREESDYKDFAEFESAKVKGLIGNAERFIFEIDRLIEEKIIS